MKSGYTTKYADLIKTSLKHQGKRGSLLCALFSFLQLTQIFDFLCLLLANIFIMAQYKLLAAQSTLLVNVYRHCCCDEDWDTVAFIVQ